KDEDVPVYPTIASQFNDPGVSWMFANLCRLLREKLHLGPDAPANSKSPVGAAAAATTSPANQNVAAPAAPTMTAAGTGIDWIPRIDTTLKEPRATVLIPGARIRYLAEIA